jgi:hypothetical protein
MPLVYQNSYQQPTCIDMGGSSGFAGITTAHISTCNGPTMLVNLNYNFAAWNTSTFYPQNPPGTIGPTDAGGRYDLFIPQNNLPGTALYTNLKNSLRTDWNGINPPVQYIVRPPKPTSLTFSPSTLQLPGTVTIAVGNGQNQTLSLIYTLPNETMREDTLTVDSSGQAQINYSCDYQGTYHYTAIRNLLDTGNGQNSTSCPNNDAYQCIGATLTLLPCP